MGFQRLPCLGYHSVRKGESRFTLGLNAAQITYYFEKRFI